MGFTLTLGSDSLAVVGCFAYVDTGSSCHKAARRRSDSPKPSSSGTPLFCLEERSSRPHRSPRVAGASAGASAAVRVASVERWTFAAERRERDAKTRVAIGQTYRSSDHRAQALSH
jgi:hypothetical protein